MQNQLKFSVPGCEYDDLFSDRVLVALDFNLCVTYPAAAASPVATEHSNHDGTTSGSSIDTDTNDGPRHCVATCSSFSSSSSNSSTQSTLCGSDTATMCSISSSATEHSRLSALPLVHCDRFDAFSSSHRDDMDGDDFNLTLDDTRDMDAGDYLFDFIHCFDSDRESEVPACIKVEEVENGLAEKPSQYLVPMIKPLFPVQPNQRKRQYTVGNVSKRTKRNKTQPLPPKLSFSANDTQTIATERGTRRRRRNEWSSEEVLLLLTCTKLLLHYELKTISQALFPLIRRDPGKCWGRAAEKKLKRMKIFDNWKTCDKQVVLKRLEEEISKFEPLSAELMKELTIAAGRVEAEKLSVGSVDVSLLDDVSMSGTAQDDGL